MLVEQENLHKKFWGFVTKNSNEKGCWEWQRGRANNGYGQVRYFNRNWRTHRLSWFLTYGNLPEKPLILLHSCDNRICVNPSHLRVGTTYDNMQDKVKRGRSSKLSELMTHCRKGHLFDERNTHTRIIKGYKIRVCRACRMANFLKHKNRARGRNEHK